MPPPTDPKDQKPPARRGGRRGRGAAAKSTGAKKTIAKQSPVRPSAPVNNKQAHRSPVRTAGKPTTKKPAPSSSSSSASSASSSSGDSDIDLDDLFQTNEPFTKKLASLPFIIMASSPRPFTEAADDTATNKTSKTPLNPRASQYTNPEKTYYTALPYDQKAEIGRLEKRMQELNKETVPLRFKLLLSRLPESIKAIAMKKVNTISRMSPQSGEYNKLMTWIEGLAAIPFGIYKGLPLFHGPRRGGVKTEEISAFLKNTKHILDTNVYGHVEAKDQIIRFLAQWVANPTTKGCVIGIHGKPGVGKTTLAKDGICKALNIPFEFMSLGSMNDSSHLLGHSYTYEGAIPGRISTMLTHAGAMNPLIYGDELDKLANNRKGEEIINVLIHMTDPAQNEHFHDHYYADIPLDLSRCIMVFTYNDPALINPILRDRMIQIVANDYTLEDKLQIARKHLIPSLCAQFSLQPADVTLSDADIRYIVGHIEPEAGVRGLRRALELIYSTINLDRLLGTIQLPFTVDTAVVQKLLHKKKAATTVPGMYL